MKDLPVFLKILAKSATGQRITCYTNLITGPRRAGDVDGPEEFHLVILDRGRTNVLGSPYRSTLRCIRCGACLNACPVYRKIGGHAYESVYPGPIGKLITPLLAGMSAVTTFAPSTRTPPCACTVTGRAAPCTVGREVMEAMRVDR